jgi:hypothetical protein
VRAPLNEVLKYFDDWLDAAGSEPELWFRGVNDANYSLLPGGGAPCVKKITVRLSEGGLHAGSQR